MPHDAGGDQQVLQRMLEATAKHYSQPDEDVEGLGAGVDAVSQLLVAKV